MVSKDSLLENVLIDIEENISENITTERLAKKYNLSERHLRRLFCVYFNQSITNYIRSRKLTASIDHLLKTNLNVLDIALEYGFDYERSYRRAYFSDRLLIWFNSSILQSYPITILFLLSSLISGNGKKLKNVQKCPFFYCKLSYIF